LRRFIPVTHERDGSHFFVRRKGVLFATPLLVCLVFLEATDIIFAVDSVPAIFALTHEPLIVFTSNIFAILGLRSLYFMLAGAVDKFYLLKYGLGVVLVFVGLKMVWLDGLFAGKFPIGVSLGIIALVITASILGSLIFPKNEGDSRPKPALLPKNKIAQLIRIGSWKDQTLQSFLFKTLGGYLLLLGLALIAAIALAC